MNGLGDLRVLRYAGRRGVAIGQEVLLRLAVDGLQLGGFGDCGDVKDGQAAHIAAIVQDDLWRGAALDHRQGRVAFMILNQRVGVGDIAAGAHYFDRAQ
jgi:hypothetical protein